MDRSDNTKPSRQAHSFAGSDPELSGAMPDSFRHAPHNRSQFDHARDPLIALQLRAMQKTESQRREDTGRDSEMITLHKPFPELRPKNENGPLRDTFNRAWMREHRAAHQALLERGRELQREQQAMADQQRAECLEDMETALPQQNMSSHDGPTR